MEIMLYHGIIYPAEQNKFVLFHKTSPRDTQISHSKDADEHNYHFINYKTKTNSIFLQKVTVPTC